jgi:ATP-dependent Clp protease, protease subunit
MRDEAILLEKIEGDYITDYVAKTRKSRSQVRAWMEAETWFTADEAKKAGFVDSIDATTPNNTVQALGSWNMAAFNKAPRIARAPAFGPAALERRNQQIVAASLRAARNA